MINGMEAYMGKKLKESVVEKRQPCSSGGYYIITRPDFYSDSMHINMWIYFDENRVITGFAGDKCYSVSRGMYNRSAKVHDREFTKRDIQYLKTFIRDNIEE
ncbi:hypothetical protein JS518_14050 [Clostridiales bacterium FE2010]|nr:hypothetical protein JS518_14050 [Clostridiales bacterium FE2010]